MEIQEIPREKEGCPMANLQKHIDNLVADYVLFSNKEILTTSEAVRYMGLSTSQLYKLTSSREIPYYKPKGKLCFFKRADLDAWMLSNQVPAIEKQSKTINGDEKEQN